MGMRSLACTAILVTATLFPTFGAAQEASAPAALIDELNALIEKGERERLADPWFLQDLRDAVAKYDNPWRAPLLSATFDADGLVPAPWRVVSGEMRVDWRHGLRALVRAPQPDTTTGSQADSRQGGNPGAQILGAILQGVLDAQRANDGDGQSPPPPTSQAPDDTTEAIALAESGITNAFKMTLSISRRDLADGSTPAYGIGVYQTAATDARPGYRFEIDEETNELALLRVNSRGGSAIIDAAPLTAMPDGSTERAVVWARYPNGRMTVQIDGATVIDTSDRGFRDAWNGMLYAVTRGDVGLKSISVLGTQG